MTSEYEFQEDDVICHIGGDMRKIVTARAVDSYCLMDMIHPTCLAWCYKDAVEKNYVLLERKGWNDGA